MSTTVDQTFEDDGTYKMASINRTAQATEGVGHIYIMMAIQLLHIASLKESEYILSQSCFLGTGLAMGWTIAGFVTCNYGINHSWIQTMTWTTSKIGPFVNSDFP